MRELVIEMVQSHQSILIQKVTLDPLTSLLKEDYHYALETSSSTSEPKASSDKQYIGLNK